MRRFLTPLVAASLVLMTACNTDPKMTDEPDAPRPSELEQSRIAMQDVMQTKLLHSRMLMEAIALEDFDDIVFNADELAALSRATEWMVHTTDHYVVFSERFREAVEGLSAAATSNDIDRVATQYIAVSASCLDCHSYLRREGLVRDLPGVISWARLATDDAPVTADPS